MRRQPARRRTAATLIELLVALVLLDLALLSLAAMSGVAARRIGEAGRRSRASVAIVNRLERIGALPCGSMSAGSAPFERAGIETWTVRRLSGIAELSDSIDFGTRPVDHVVLRKRVTC